MRHQNSRLGRLALTIPAALATLAIAAPAVSGAATEPPAGANVEVVKMEVVKGALKFVAPKTVTEGDYLEVVNKTNPRKVGPHTFSLVTQGALPKTPKARKACFTPKHICLSIAKWHKFNPKTENISVNPVDVGPEGWSTMGAVKKKGDSWFTEKLNDSIVQQITANATTAPKTIHFICAVHPWMQGKTTVLPAAG